MAQANIAELRAPAAQNLQIVQVGFDTTSGFEALQRMAKMFNSSSIVPESFQGESNIGSAAIALDMAIRMRANPLMVMQNLYTVHGRPAWSAQFLIATLNQSGKFSALRYEFQGTEGDDDWGCRAVVTELSNNEKLSGPLVTIGLAKKEGWYDRKGSKWKSIPELMLRYRAAAWFVRSYAPEIAMGLPTAEEARDTIDLERSKDGTYTVEMETIKAASFDVQPPKPTPEESHTSSKNAKTEMDTLRNTTRALWESTGNTLEEAEKLTGLYLKQWNRATCTKVEEEARRVLAVKPASDMQVDLSDASTIKCPRVDALIDDMECAQCHERDGCPSWG